MNHRLPPPFPNHPFFSPNPSFNRSPIPDPNPNPNPNFSSTFFLPLPPSPPQFNASQPQPQSQSQNAPLPDLRTSLSLLTDLLELSSSTLLSLSSLLSQHPASLSSDGFSRCPFNPNHLLSPESLFLHSLHCPAPIAGDFRSILEDLHYPKTLKAERQLIEQNKFAHPLSDPHAELCFSLDEYVDFGSNFFYQDCPGVVSSSSEDGAKRMFSLPGVLSVECANFSCHVDREINWVLKGSFRLLPSELWVVKCEIEQWRDFPKAYSYSILRMLLCIEMVKERDLLMWVIANSPRFGVIIDSPTRDHIFLLFRLCLKVIVREAYHSYESLLKEDLEDTGGLLNPKTQSFSCPALHEVLSWLSNQLSVLYGEANAKSFPIGMVKHLLLNVASNSLLYPLDQNMDRAPDNERGSMITGGNVVAEQSLGQVGESEGDSVERGGIVSRGIFVYQVAAAIAALHERSLLEEKIKALRSPQHMPAYQRVAEHDYLSKKAQEERQKRQNYRPLIEHDGLPLQRSLDKDATGRNKTKEELLAEERDYKRRRMSYRGKKLKRNTKEVMRDIIEEHMEAIKQAGGIGCLDKGVVDGSASTSKPLVQEYAQNMEFNRSTSYEYESSRDQHDVYKKHLNSDYSSQSTSYEYESSRDQHNVYKKHLNSDYSSQTTDPIHVERRRYDRKVSSRNRHRGDSYHRSPGRDRNHGQRSVMRKETDEGDSYPRSPSKERDGRSRDERSARRNETEEQTYKSRSTSEYHGNRSSSRTSTAVHSGRKDKRQFEDSDRERRKRYRKDRMDSTTGSGFDDRYAPSRSPDM